jgi:lysozyme
MTRLNQNQFDALCDFVFNVKVDEFLRSTLREFLKEGDYRSAALEFPRWVYAEVNGEWVKLPGLVTRRAKEQALFNKPV